MVTYPDGWSVLKHPWWRFELLAYLEELATPDPRPIWEEERRRGLISDIDQVFHFLFDDHEFDEGDVGYTLFDRGEAQVVRAIKRALQAVLADLPDGSDDDFVGHPRWSEVTKAASSALSQMKTR